MQRPRRRIIIRQTHRLNRSHLTQNPLRLRHDFLPHRRQMHIRHAPLKQRHAQLLLEFFNAHRQRRLADKTRRSSLAKMFFTRERDDVA